MRIPKTVTQFARWARSPRLKPGRIMSIGACVAMNEATSERMSGVLRVMGVVAEECALRWMEDRTPATRKSALRRLK